MASELITFTKVWLTAYTSLIYCFFISKLTTKPIPRLIAFTPILSLFLTLPLFITSVHLCGVTAFFLAWLATFKLLLFAFRLGPLSSPNLSLPQFILLASFPIKIHQDSTKIAPKSPLNYALKALIFAALVRSHEHTHSLNPNVILVLYSFHIYLCLEIILFVAAALARALLGLELEPQFDEPYLSTSLQDFWGRRWNLMVTRILRPTVYKPVLKFSGRFVGRKWAPFPAVLATFTVSGLMHELIFFYLGRVRPTWEITCFFLLHGVCLAAEIAVKRALEGKFRLPRGVSGTMTVAFVMATGFWLFFPPLLRLKGDVRAFEEYAAVGAFLREVGEAFGVKSLNVTML